MKHLFVLRHAKAAAEEHGGKDHDRRLTDRGKRDADRMGTILGSLAARPKCVLCSTARRTRKTAKRVLAAAALELQPLLLDDLYLAPVSTLEFVLRKHGESDCVMLVGHNPGLEMLVSQLSNELCSLPTSGLVLFELDVAQWSDFSITTPRRKVGFWQPDVVDS